MFERLCVLLLLVACDPGGPPLNVDWFPPEGEISIPVFEFINPKDSAALRNDFSWEATSPLEEIDTTEQQPREALYNAMVFVQSPDHILELDEMGAHVSQVPLFEEEWDDAQVPETPFKLTYEDDGEGMFVYTLLPASTYNAMRESALMGPLPDRAGNIRAIPEEA